MSVSPVVSVCLETGASTGGCQDHRAVPSVDCDSGAPMLDCCPLEPVPVGAMTVAARDVRDVKAAADLAAVQLPILGEGRDPAPLGAGRPLPARTDDSRRYILLSSYLL